MKIKKQTSETFRLGLMLSLVGGFTDAYTFIIRGKGVFLQMHRQEIWFFLPLDLLK